MTPIEEARLICAELGYDFDQERAQFEETGYTYAGLDGVIFARPVGLAWWVWLAVGPNALQRFCTLVPFPLPRVAFARELRGRSETRVYSFTRFQALAKIFSHGRQTSETRSTPSPDSSGLSDLAGHCGG